MKQVHMVILDHKNKDNIKKYFSEKGGNIDHTFPYYKEVAVEIDNSVYILRDLKEISVCSLKGFNLNSAIICNNIKTEIPEECLMVLKSCLRINPVTEEIIYI